MPLCQGTRYVYLPAMLARTVPVDEYHVDLQNAASIVNLRDVVSHALPHAKRELKPTECTAEKGREVLPLTGNANQTGNYSRKYNKYAGGGTGGAGGAIFRGGREPGSPATGAA